MAVGRDQPLLLDIEAAAAILGITRRQLFNLDRTGRVPRPLRLRRNMRWRTAELELWRERAYPTRDQWEGRRDGRWVPWHLGLPFPPDNDARGEGPPWLIDRSRFAWRRKRDPHAPSAAQM